MEVWVTGGSWIASEGYGRMSEGKSVGFKKGKPCLPPGKELFSPPLVRYGRFDEYTRLGCAGAALALNDAGLDPPAMKTPVGLITSSTFECMATDLAYYQTTLAEGGAFSSPNLFSYTLPGIVLGECAAYFKLRGPVFCIGETGERGWAALKTSLEMLCSGKADVMIAGWIESPPENLSGVKNEGETFPGCLFTILERESSRASTPRKRIIYENHKIRFVEGREIKSLLDFF